MTLARAEASALRRKDRYRRRSALRRVGAAMAHAAGSWESVPFKRCAGCGVVNIEDVVSIKVQHGDDGPTAFATGVSTCGSVWACAVCSAKVRTRRAIEVQTIASSHAAAGGSLAMLTLTVRHRPGDSLGALMDAQSDAWRSIQRDSRWTDGVRPFLVGMVRSWEVTHSFLRNGDKRGSWHPHFHVLLLWSGDYDEDCRQRSVAWIEEAWANRIERRLGSRPNQHGYNYTRLDASAAEYVAKIGNEVTRADLKGGAQVWQLIDGLEDGEVWARNRVIEYFTATKGRRAIQFSRGLRERFGLDVLTDEEVAAIEVDGETVMTIPPKRWYKLCRYRYRQAPAFLDLLERIEREVRLPEPVALL